jgi:predicted ATPase
MTRGSEQSPELAAIEDGDFRARLLGKLSHLMRAISVHDLSVAALRAPAFIQQGAVLGPDGWDVAAVLDNMAGEAPSLRDAIDETVRRAAHEVKRIVTRPGPQPGTKVLGVEEKDGRVYGAEDMSDGLLLFIGLAVAAQLKAGTQGVLAIEEPERGIHPRRLRDLVDHLLRLTKSGMQVVLTTHSPTLLDEFRDSPESVLIFDRDDQGTHITRLSERPDWVKELKGASLGELWYSGVLGGVPAR